MGERFARTLRTVTVVHVVILLLLTGGSCLKAFTRSRREIVMPIDFLVAVPLTEQAAEPAPVIQEVAPRKSPVPAKEAPKEKRKIQVSRDLVSRTSGQMPVKTPSPEEIERLLREGAKPSDHTSIPSEDARCRARIRDKLYALWSQPSYAEVGELVTEVSLTLGPAGVVESIKLTSKSGNHVLDTSVQLAVESVSRIEGLTASFLQRHRTVTVSFQVVQ